MDRTEEAPFRQIAAELRRRITNGTLGTGQRVPSTRQVAKEFAVALATAAKALDVLRQEGLIVTRPRSGSVVAAPPRSPQAAHNPAASELNRNLIVGHAIDIADTAGLPAVSMRAVAGRCGVSPMSLYRHFDSKEELILSMADTAYGTIDVPNQVAQPWRSRIEELASELWRIHARHPWLSHMHPVTRPTPVPSLLAIGDHMLAALNELALPPAVRFDVYVLIHGHITGVAANREKEDIAISHTGVSHEEWADLRYQPTMRSDDARLRYPALVGMFGPSGQLEDGYDLDLDRLFTVGLRLLLDGIETLSANYEQPS
ncbi:GntR family transcriptional regulator [Natronoglycomyces albus]|uniref:GntR family transcriptional regulator n=1 Tax=Natronoglycomyces albus TaxID=2811108 RepID=A0A895XNW0_9ACTN|nr:GntR family transcriptional regulator [Natronoglycomyces albus]QSB04186.1 GntR family transcriptional regulator [Natronoglycomyces albus]